MTPPKKAIQLKKVTRTSLNWPYASAFRPLGADEMMAGVEPCRLSRATGITAKV
jgi:hypothetical protein